MSSTAGLPVQTAPNALFAALNRARARLESGFDALLAREAVQLPLWIPVLLGLGVAAAIALPWAAQRHAALLVMAALLAAGLLLRGAATTLLAGAGAVMLLGYGVAQWRIAAVAAPRLEQPGIVQLVGIITEAELRDADGSIRLRIAPFDPALPPGVRVSVAMAANAPAVRAALVPGARVSLTALLTPPPGPALPGGYDFARQAWFERLGATGSALGAVSVLETAPPPQGLRARLAAARAALTAHVMARLPGTAGSFAAAFVTGERGAIPAPVAQAMRDSGLAHLLSISGLHIAIVAAGTMWLIRKLLSLWPWLALRIPVRIIGALGGAAAAVAYTLLAGADIPMLRACLATVIVLAGIIIGREAMTLRMVAAAACIILLTRPEALFSPSFQLSFAAVTGLVAFYQSQLGQDLHRFQLLDGWAVRLARNLMALLVTGLVAEVMLAPTALYHFNRASAFGVIANLLAIPLTSFVIMPLQIVALALDALGLGAPAWWLLGHAYDLLIAWAQRVAGWPGGVLTLPSMSAGVYALFIGGGLWMCLWSGRARFWGAAPIAIGFVMALLTRPPDLLISADGRQIGVRVPGNGLAQLQARTTSFTVASWRSASAADTALKLARLPGAHCHRFGCSVPIGDRRGSAQLFVTRGAQLPPPALLAASCARADIVVSALALPPGCRPRVLRVDHAVLLHTQALAVWLAPPRLRSSAAEAGDQPWRPVPPASWQPLPAQ